MLQSSRNKVSHAFQQKSKGTMHATNEATCEANVAAIHQQQNKQL
jgi:hypothetical protein